MYSHSHCGDVIRSLTSNCRRFLRDTRGKYGDVFGLDLPARPKEVHLVELHKGVH